MKKKIDIEDYYWQIQCAAAKALVIFNALGYNSHANKNNWVNNKSFNNGVTDLIEGLVKNCIERLNSGSEETTFSTGMIEVSMYKEENYAHLNISFNLL